jgi:hypothetical protein
VDTKISKPRKPKVLAHQRFAEYLMPPQKVEHDIIEAAWLLPGHGVASIVDDGPFVIAQMRGPDTHQGWGSKKICVCGNDKCRG